MHTRADTVEKWGHDLYVEDEQGPRQQWEKEKVQCIYNMYDCVLVTNSFSPSYPLTPLVQNIHVRCSWFFFGKVLCYFVCLTLLASFFLSSASLISMYICLYSHVFDISSLFTSFQDARYYANVE